MASMASLPPPPLIELEEPPPPPTLEFPPPKLSHPVKPPSLPTGTPATRFLKRATAANAPIIAVNGALSHLGVHVVAALLNSPHRYYVCAVVPQGADTSPLCALSGAQARLLFAQVRDPAADDALPTLLVAFRGASAVVHMPSFASSATACRRVVPALKLALDAASMPGQIVRNFIFLSSEATVYDSKHHRPRHRRAMVTLCENNWFDCSKPSRATTHPHAYAHTVAELRLWARVAKRRLPFNVVSLIPSFILGPVLSRRHVPVSPPLALLAAAARGELDVVDDVPFAPVDVRDVADAVVRLVQRPHIGGRLLLSACPFTTAQLFHFARSRFPFYPWPRMGRPKHLSLFAAPFAKGLTPTAGAGGGGSGGGDGGRARHSFAAFRGDEISISTSKATRGASQSSSVLPIGTTSAPMPLDVAAVLKGAHFMARDRIGRRYAFSQERVSRELGLECRSVEETLRDTLHSFERFNVIAIHHPPQQQQQTHRHIDERRRRSGPLPPADGLWVRLGRETLARRRSIR